MWIRTRRLGLRRQTAIRRACSTRSVGCRGCVAQPITRREYRSMICKSVILPQSGSPQNGVTTLKFASTHEPRFLTGFPTTSAPPISERPLPFIAQHSTGCFYPAQAGHNPERFFRMSPSAVIRANTRLSLRFSASWSTDDVCDAAFA